MIERRPPEPRHIIVAKRRLSRARVGKYQAMPADRETWLRQMDDVAATLGIQNIYRAAQSRQQAAE
jgi:hypothetical protein